MCDKIPLMTYIKTRNWTLGSLEHYDHNDGKGIVATGKIRYIHYL